MINSKAQPSNVRERNVLIITENKEGREEMNKQRKDLGFASGG